MQTFIVFNEKVKPLTPSNLEMVMRFKLTEKLNTLEKKLERAKKPFNKMVYRSLIAEVNQKLASL